MDNPHVEFSSHTLETKTLDGVRRWPRADRQNVTLVGFGPAQQHGSGSGQSGTHSAVVWCAVVRGRPIFYFSDFDRPRPRQEKKREREDTLTD